MKSLVVIKRGDPFGQYEILLKCSACNHTRRCFPTTLAAFAGWVATLDEIVKRLRCIKCHERRCIATAHRVTAPRQHNNH